MKNSYRISISGDKKHTDIKAKALTVLASKLDAKTLKALAHVVKNDPEKVNLAKGFLGI